MIVTPAVGDTSIVFSITNTHTLDDGDAGQWAWTDVNGTQIGFEYDEDSTHIAEVLFNTPFLLPGTLTILNPAVAATFIPPAIIAPPYTYSYP